MLKLNGNLIGLISYRKSKIHADKQKIIRTARRAPGVQLFVICKKLVHLETVFQFKKFN